MSMFIFHIAYALVRNLRSSDDQLTFKDFTMWEIPQGSALKLAKGRELFPGVQVNYRDWVYERHYDTAPASHAEACSGFGNTPMDTEDTLLLLRLFKPGDLSFVRQSIHDMAGNSYTQLPYRVISDVQSSFPYRLSQAEVPTWDGFATEMKASQAWSSPWFQAARRFFLYGGAKEFNVEWNEIDRIVDYVIALEATLVPETDFARRRVSERGAMLLCGKGPTRAPERQKAKHLLKKLYDLRSVIAHGGDLRPRHLKFLRDQRPEVEGIVRDVLKAALRLLVSDGEGRRQQLRGFYDSSIIDHLRQMGHHVRAIWRLLRSPAVRFFA